MTGEQIEASEHGLQNTTTRTTGEDVIDRPVSDYRINKAFDEGKVLQDIATRREPGGRDTPFLEGLYALECFLEFPPGESIGVTVGRIPVFPETQSNQETNGQ